MNWDLPGWAVAGLLLVLILVLFLPWSVPHTRVVQLITAWRGGREPDTGDGTDGNSRS